MNTEPHPDNHYHLDDTPRYPAGSGSDEIDPDEAILDDAKREMFGDDADLLPDDMGAK